MVDEKPSTLMDLVFQKGKKDEEQRDRSLLGEKLYPYKAVMCRNCGRIQVTRGEEMFRCRNCGKACRYRKYGKWNVKLKDFPTFEEAMMEAKRWAMEESKNNSDSYLMKE